MIHPRTVIELYITCILMNLCINIGCIQEILNGNEIAIDERIQWRVGKINNLIRNLADVFYISSLII